MKKIRVVLIALVIAGGTGWLAIGPDWRALVANPPTDTDVLFWSVAQRDAGFRLMDAVPVLAKARRIHAGDAPLALADGDPLDVPMLDEAMTAQRISGLVVLHKGKVRLERYGLGFTPDGRWTSFSVAKSFTSTLVGAAINDGFIESLQDPVSKYIGGLKGSAYDEVTIGQLLTMTSGVAWNEDYEDPKSDVARFLQAEPDGDERSIVSYMKKLPRAHPPGTVWHYSTGETNLIGVLVSEAVGKPLAVYLEEAIWRPFGMEADATWILSRDGSEISGCCVQASTRDFARFGLFVLADGAIGGKRVVPDGWFAAATTKRADINLPGEGYGYQWWTLDDGAFQARGIFGQGIFIDPARDLVIAVNANWKTALGQEHGERKNRTALYEAIRTAIDQQ